MMGLENRLRAIRLRQAGSLFQGRWSIALDLAEERRILAYAGGHTHFQGPSAPDSTDISADAQLGSFLQAQTARFCTA